MTVHALTEQLACIHCGKPVRPVHGGETCRTCGEPVYYHEDIADSLACPGTSPHVQPAGPFADGAAAARTSSFGGTSDAGQLDPGGWNFAAPVTEMRGGSLARFSAAMRGQSA